jgi:hypothetical protein
VANIKPDFIDFGTGYPTGPGAWSHYTYDLVNGGANLAPGNYILRFGANARLGSASNAFAVGIDNASIYAVPEPATFVLFGTVLGLAGLARTLRTRRTKTIA